MNQETPAATIRAKDLEANRLALEELIRAIPPVTVRSVLDIRYGLGGWARTVTGKFPSAYYAGYEADPITFELAWRGDGESPVVYNQWFSADAVDFRPDLLLADFNTTTVKKRELLDEVVHLPARWLIFTDVACVKLHLNFGSYGLEQPSLADYWARFDVPGFHLIKFARKHHAASTALYRRTSNA